jgi:hypothetical protein
LFQSEESRVNIKVATPLIMTTAGQFIATRNDHMLKRMSRYQRPHFDRPVFTDETGAVIPYGRRWRDLPAGAPAAAYSVVTHQERFAPLITVAEELIRHLSENYAVTITEERHATPGRVVRITPQLASALPLTVTMTDFPAVELQAGFFARVPFPDCGCDACDDDIVDLVSALEQTVQAVVRGYPHESLAHQSSRWQFQRSSEPSNNVRATFSVGIPVPSQSSSPPQKHHRRRGKLSIIHTPRADLVTEFWSFPDGSNTQSSHVIHPDQAPTVAALQAFLTRHPEGPHPWPRATGASIT